MHYVPNFAADIFVMTEIPWTFISFFSCLDFQFSFSLIDKNSKSFIFVIFVVIIPYIHEKTLPITS